MGSCVGKPLADGRRGNVPDHSTLIQKGHSRDSMLSSKVIPRWNANQQLNTVKAIIQGFRGNFGCGIRGPTPALLPPSSVVRGMGARADGWLRVNSLKLVGRDMIPYPPDSSSPLVISHGYLDRVWTLSFP